MYKIANLNIKNRLILAPMAGVCDKAFREVCKDFGAGLTVTEMVSSKALSFNDKKTKFLMENAPNEDIFSVQIFGSEPAAMADASIKAVERVNASLIDINMGCPAPKITKNGDGCSLMRDIKKAQSIISATCKASPVPVTVKFRLGFSEKNFLDFGRMAQDSGASAVTLHARTGTAGYSGTANWDDIALLKQTLSIPVIANGDVTTPQLALDMLSHTGADFVMIGRGACGNPFIFERSLALFSGAPDPGEPTLEKKLEVAKHHMELAAKYKGEYPAMLESRKHLMWYLKGTRGAKYFREDISKITSLDELYIICDKILTMREEIYG